MKLFCLVIFVLLMINGYLSVYSTYENKNELKEWISKERIEGFGKIDHTFRIGLFQRNLDSLEELFYKISDPLNEKYFRKYIDQEKLTEMIKPNEEDELKIRDFIRSKLNIPEEGKEIFDRNVFHLYINKDYMFVTLPISQIEKLFAIEMNIYIHIKNGRTIIATKDEVHIPSNIPIKSISNINDFLPNSIRKYLSNNIKVLDKGEDITPEILTQLYGLNKTDSNGNIMIVRGSRVENVPQASQAVAEFQEAYFYPSDLTLFQNTYGLPLLNVSNIIGINAPNYGYLGEASLDVEWITTVGSNITTWDFSFSQFDMVNWAMNVTSTPNAPLVHSVSWGGNEKDYKLDYLDDSNTEFQKMGVLGFSIFVASGDVGTGNSGLFSCNKFEPQFPASSPFVTTVGGTYIDSGSTEEVCVKFSGGGFSNVFSVPDYQATTVQNYLTNNAGSLPAQKHYNSSGRAIPDISALSTNFVTIIEKANGKLSGTSAATPVVAGIFSLINNFRWQGNKAPLGFVNPGLYQLQNVGYDVVSGENNDPTFCSSGFESVKGYDCCSGLGTPRFSDIYNYFMQQ